MIKLVILYGVSLARVKVGDSEGLNTKADTASYISTSLSVSDNSSPGPSASRIMDTPHRFAKPVQGDGRTINTVNGDFSSDEMLVNAPSTVDDFPEPVLQTGPKSTKTYPQFRDGYLPAAGTNFQPALQIEREVFERKWKVAAGRHIRLCMSEMGVTIPILHREICEG
jgi:hypothetical protein